MKENRKEQFSTTEAVFRRDGFTCQKCGKKAPEVILYAEYKNSPNNGGVATVDNLITYCRCCNGGRRKPKKDKYPKDELIERGEQLLMLMRWMEDKSSSKDELVQMVKQYIHNKIEPYTINKTGEKNLKNFLKNNELSHLISCIDEAFDKFIKYKDDEITHDSAEEFFKAIGRFAYVSKQNEIVKKLYYIRGICKNRYRDYKQEYDHQPCIKMLKDYADVLSEHYDESQLLNDLENEVQRNAKELQSWKDFKALIIKWTNDIKKWEKENIVSETGNKHDFAVSPEDIESFAERNFQEAFGPYSILCYLYKNTLEKETDTEWNKIAQSIYACLTAYLLEQKEIFERLGKIPDGDGADVKEKYRTLIYWETLFRSDYKYSLELSVPADTLFYISESLSWHLFDDILSYFNYYTMHMTVESSLLEIEYALKHCAEKMTDTYKGKPISQLNKGELLQYISDNNDIFESWVPEFDVDKMFEEYCKENENSQNNN